MAPESLDRLREAFPVQDWLGAEQVATCLKWARDPVCCLCSADVFPLDVQVQEGKACIKLELFSKLIDDGVQSAVQGAASAAGKRRAGSRKDITLIRLFQAELRSEIYRIEMVRAMQSLMDFTERMVIDPEAVDERCLSQLELSKRILQVEARGLVTNLKDLLDNTAAPLLERGADGDTELEKIRSSNG